MSDPLDEYRRKRDFTRTSEPETSRHEGADHPRFVVHRHAARALHFDLRIEDAGVLRSWAVPKGIPLRHGDRRLAVQTEPHPVEYLTFTGTIPDGAYGAGLMTIWDTGTVEPVLLGADEVKVRLHGDVLDGEYHLVRTEGRDWLVFRARSAAQGPPDPAPAFRAMRPMLATSASEPFDDDAWSFEIKWDGWRALVLSGPEGSEIRGRSGRELTDRFPGLRDLRRAFDCQELIVDGEICVLDRSGRSDFSALQAGQTPVTLVVFDLLYIDGLWLCERPYAERRDVLRQVVVAGALEQVLMADDVQGNGRALFRAVADGGGEGIVAKRRAGTYRPGVRSADWRKIKTRHEIDVMVCGFAPGEGSRRSTFGALVLGERTGSGLRYVGRVGSGFSDAALTELRRRLDRLVAPEGPFDVEPPGCDGVRWVRPAIRCRVAYAERTADGLLRAPVYLGAVEDEPADAPVPVLDRTASELRVRDDDREVRLTNLGKVFWPREGITKGDILDHYARCAPVLVPHLRGRPMVLKRYPNGIDGPHFFQHELPDNAPEWLGRAELRASDGTVTYGLVDDALSLLWMVNLGCIDLNPWHARVGSIEYADHVLFDLDPQDGIRFDEICEAALMVADALREMGLRCHPKTSGSRGMHVFVPIEPAPHETVRLFAQLVARSVVARRPDLMTVEVAKRRRGRRIYVDTNQNGYGKTVASVYSVRPVPGATVSTPLTWDEVSVGVDPEGFTVAAVAARIADRGDLFGEVLRRDQNLVELIEAM